MNNQLVSCSLSRGQGPLNTSSSCGQAPRLDSWSTWPQTPVHRRPPRSLRSPSPTKRPTKAFWKQTTVGRACSRPRPLGALALSLEQGARTFGSRGRVLAKPGLRGAAASFPCPELRDLNEKQLHNPRPRFSQRASRKDHSTPRAPGISLPEQVCSLLPHKGLSPVHPPPRGPQGAWSRVRAQP